MSKGCTQGTSQYLRSSGGTVQLWRLPRILSVIWGPNIPTCLSLHVFSYPLLLQTKELSVVDVVMTITFIFLIFVHFQRLDLFYNYPKLFITCWDRYFNFWVVTRKFINTNHSVDIIIKLELGTKISYLPLKNALNVYEKLLIAIDTPKIGPYHRGTSSPNEP